MGPHSTLGCWLLGLSGITAYLTFSHSAKEDPTLQETAAFRAFRDNYVFVFSTAMAGDWLQGPYIYHLYEHYGYTVGPIGQLFIAGFGSSMLFGTLAGVMADKYGRRRACLAYCLTYTISCFTKHSGSFWVLLVGRILGGVSTSLLFSSFESWVASEHARRGFDEALLANLFSRASTVGAGMMAITAGLVGDVLVERFSLGPVAPFDAASLVLLLTGVVVWATWTENYGGESHEGVGKRLRSAATTICSDPRIALLGALQAFFEATLYTFVFLWTPALGSGGEKVPHGMVFSCFMAACMAGSALAGRLLVRWRPQKFMLWVYLAALVSMAVPFFAHLPQTAYLLRSPLVFLDGRKQLGLSSYLQIGAFCLFELCLGIFWPAMMTLRAQLVPEDMRSTVINCFRIPLNLFVCVALFKVGDYSLATMFGLCMTLLTACVVCQAFLNMELSNTHHRSSADREDREAQPLVTMRE